LGAELLGQSIFAGTLKMALAERAEALSRSGFATMIREKPANQVQRAQPATQAPRAQPARADDFQDDRENEVRAVSPSRTADMLPPVSWAS
jgi:hypothetical protein